MVFLGVEGGWRVGVGVGGGGTWGGGNLGRGAPGEEAFSDSCSFSLFLPRGYIVTHRGVAGCFFVCF